MDQRLIELEQIIAKAKGYNNQSKKVIIQYIDTWIVEFDAEGNHTTITHHSDDKMY